ncbi:hypothetical protein Glove_469g29 [Diversispora epigaea]|uniref:Protein kinase domain-containing protein n=1 Tax=Diversispora epigaea TaxID=1348612 RepID=A0A397GLA0_9GLOM|nr:hypothetical protein Glove_469g29 [Diversispora epigaea]
MQYFGSRNGKQGVCLKSLNNLTNKNDFLQEIENQLKFRGKKSIAIYGITKNPTENEYMMVMDYAKLGSLRKLLNNKFEELTWRKKTYILFAMTDGLTNIHNMGLMRKDFHPVSENDREKIYGIIPYMAPETLSRGEYTQASDIYSFGMVMLEVLTSYPPYYNIPHNENLAMDICKGLKPEIKCEIPQFFKEIMEKCWNFEPFNRPTAKEMLFQLNGLTNIHNMGLMRKDFHPVSENDREKIYGIIPYMAPETLSRGEYTQASDIYSFGMVMLEVLTSYPPYYNIPHNENLAMDICKGLKPEIKCEIPQFFKEIMEKCWNFEPFNRPTAKEMLFQLSKYFNDSETKKQVKKQIKVAKKSNKDFFN